MTPPYSTNGQGSVGANSVRPCNLAAAQDSAGEQCSPLRRTAKPPLCKGRWHGVSRDGGIGTCMDELGCTRKVTIPQSASLTAPFTQGSLQLYPHRVYLAPEGSIGEVSKSVKKNAALLHFLAFGRFDLLFGVLRGEQPLRRAPRAIASSGHLFRFLFGCPKRKACG